MKKYVLMAAALLAFGLASAQTSNEIVTKYNEGAAAMQAKDFAKAAALLEQVVVEGMDSEDNTVLNCVQTSKKYIPNCYYRLGGNAIKAGNYDEALANFSKSAEKAELYGDSQAKMKANAWVAKVYLVQGGEAFNNKDYATAAEVFAKGYAANPRNTEMALNLAMSYCESGEYEKGMEVYRNICNMPADKYAEA
ncbi:MAG: tetratricopeptide repeat protein, partial [Alistipes sp.]|nr:tetratricopeptide repeat protein [Alistipes sp.]